jgi:hypothetical protein
MRPRELAPIVPSVDPEVASEVTAVVLLANLRRQAR